MRSRVQLLVIPILLMVIVPAAAVAEIPDDEQLRAIHSRLVSELMSPFCHGLTLANCPTSGAAGMRDQIWSWLLEGRSEEWIVDTLVDEWGETILGAPRFRGIGLVAWLAPAILLVAAGAGLVWWLRRSVGRAVEAPGSVLPASAGGRDDVLEQQVEREIDALVE